MAGLDGLNRSLLRRYQQLCDDVDTRKTHYFLGRYENTYISKHRIPEVSQILDRVIARAADQTGVPTDKLQAGFWFNAMGLGHTTTRHRHDDDDELLSAVYYLRVPEDSGNLLLYTEASPLVIEPVAGLLVCFDPTCEHEVTRNNSDHLRLSIGINVGPYPAPTD